MGIVLIGFMGTGKSTIAKKLGEVLKLEIVEMDQRIEYEEKKSISKIFETDGEDYFRNLETEMLKKLQDTEVIISCGGGTPLRECNVKEMKKNGPVFLLTAHPLTILERVRNNTDRPLLKNNMTIEHIENMLNMRKEKYEAAADYVVETDEKNVEQICQEIIEVMRKENIKYV